MDKGGYGERLGRVRAYIDAHLGEELSVERLSEVAQVSKYHFQRQFSGWYGITVFRYVQRMRLRQASYWLAFGASERVIDIALEAGFETPESFARAFKQTFGQTPSGFRKHPAWAQWHDRYPVRNRERRSCMEVHIIVFEETRVAARQHRGASTGVNDSAKIFIEWRRTSGLSPVRSSRSFGIAYDDPNTTDPEHFRFDICGSVEGDVPENPQGVIAQVIPGGRCAVVRHLGAHDRLGEAAYGLYRDWLPQSGEELRDFPLFFHYLNLMPETPEHALITDVYLPLK